MLHRIDTEIGEISIEKAVIRKIVTECIASFDGKVVLTNHKGQISSIATKIGVIDENNYITIIKNDNGIDIKIYIVLRFGTSISLVTDQLILNIKEKVKEITDIETESITIIVAGMISKQIVRRNIEVKG